MRDERDRRYVNGQTGLFIKHSHMDGENENAQGQTEGEQAADTTADQTAEQQAEGAGEEKASE